MRRAQDRPIKRTHAGVLLLAVFSTALAMEEARAAQWPVKRLRTFDPESADTAPDEFARRIAREMAMWTKAANIRLD